MKHTLTFIFLGLVSIKITLALFKGVFHTEKHQLFFRVITVVSIVTSLTVISISQRNYIMEVETPPLERCYYYDEFGNYIHSSRLLYNCPEPEVVKTENSLTMTFDYTYYGSGEGYSGSSSNGITNYQYRKIETGGAKIKVEVRYSEDNIIEYYRLQEVSNYYADDYTKDESEPDHDKAYTLESHTLITNYYELVIETQLNYGEIIQNIQEFRLTDVIDGSSDISDYQFHLFNTDNPYYETEYRVEYNELNEHIGYEFELYQEVLKNDTYSTELLYEGYVTGTKLYFENEEPYYGDNEYSVKTYNYMINDTNNTSSLVEKDFGSVTDYDFTKLKDSGLFVLTEEHSSTIYNSITDYSRTYKIISYADFVYFKFNNDSCLLYDTDYGYLIEQYGSDGIKDDSELSSSIGEMEYVNSGYDYIVLGTGSNTNLFYEYAPIFDYNPIIKYLLSLTE